jgi:hypothetical protein
LRRLIGQYTSCIVSVVHNPSWVDHGVVNFRLDAVAIFVITFGAEDG